MLLGRPIIEAAPSGLRKLTRFTKLEPDQSKIAALGTTFPAYGTADVEFTSAFLIDQRIDKRGEMGAAGTLIQVYQELADNALTATTEVVETTTHDGRRVTRRLYLCKASQAEALRPEIGSGDPAIFQVVIETLGPVSKVSTFDIEITDDGFVYSTTDAIKHNGALLLRTIRTLATVADTPSGFTLIDTSEENNDGYTIYVAQFAKGEGEIDRTPSTRFNGKLLRMVIRYLTAPEVTTQPTSDPLTGFEPSNPSVMLDVGRSEQDGYRLWTVVWTKALMDGYIRNEVIRKNNGKLIVYLLSRFNVAPDAPAATIGGTVNLVESGTSLEEGYTIYHAKYAEGLGVIERSRSVRNKGKLVIYRFQSLGVAPTAPAATIGGTVVLTQDDDRDSDGVTIYDRTWAEGKGVVSKRSQARDGGLRLETWESFGDGYDDTFMKPVGILMAKDYDELDGVTRWTVTCMQRSNGASLDFSIGQVTAINVTNGGNSYLVPPVITLTAPPPGGIQAEATAVLTGNTVSSVTVDNPGSGYLVAPTVTFVPPGSGGADAAATAVIDGAEEFALQFETYHPFDYPGRAKTTLTTLNTFKAYDIFKSPPIRVNIPATVRISYQTSNEVGALPFPHWNPQEWTTIFAKHKSYPDGWPRMISESLPGYRAIDETAIDHDGGLVGALLVTQLGERVAQAPALTPYQIKLSGGPEDPEGNTYVIAKPDVDPAFVALDGTQYYRRTLIIAEIPAQPALSV